MISSLISYFNNNQINEFQSNNNNQNEFQSNLNYDVINQILNYIFSVDYSDDIKVNNKKHLNYYLVLKNSKYKKQLKNNKIIFNFQNKYNYYIKSSYKCDHHFYRHSMLYDALMTDCDLPYADSTFETFTNEIYDDIKLMIKYYPESINFKDGSLRCRNEVTPLFASCINHNIPLDIIRLLIDNGADKNHQILVNGYKTDYLIDLEDNISSYRLSKIKKIFNKN